MPGINGVFKRISCFALSLCLLLTLLPLNAGAEEELEVPESEEEETNVISSYADFITDGVFDVAAAYDYWLGLDEPSREIFIGLMPSDVMYEMMSYIYDHYTSDILSLNSITLDAKTYAGLPSALALEYDDRFTFEDANDVELAEGCTALELDGKTIRAAAVTDSPVTVIVDGVACPVSVSKASLCVVLVDGQSNAFGLSGSLNGEAVAADPGDGYVWRDSELKDLNTYVAALESEYPDRSVGFTPAFAAEWHELSGEKCVIINVAHSGCPIEYWAEGFTDTGVSVLNKCFAALDPELYNVKRGFYLWLQGESNSSIVPAPSNYIYDTAAEYETQFEPVHQAYISAFAPHGITACGGILACRGFSEYLTSSAACEYCGVRAAQQALANQYENVFMVSDITEGWSRGDSTSAFGYAAASGRFSVSGSPVSSLFDGLHYTQPAYDMQGLQAADNLYRGFVLRTPATDFRLVGQDGATVYAPTTDGSDGDTVWLESIMREVGPENEQETFSAQLAVVPTVRYGVCSGVTIELKRASDGKAVTGVIGSNGYIPDVRQLTENMYLTVTMGSVSKTYKLTSRNFSRKSKGKMTVEAVPEIKAGDTVWVDGVSYTAGKGGLITLPDSRGKVLTTYTFNTSNNSDPHAVYPTGMKVWLLDDTGFGTFSVTYANLFDNVLGYAGSSIRITGNKGIRMITSIPKDVKEALAGSGLAGYTLLEYGTVVAWDSSLKGADLTLSAPGAKSNYAYLRGSSDPVFAYKGKTVQYTNVLVGFSLEQCKADLSMRPYMKLKSPDGVTLVIYGGTIHRSIGYIAWQNRDAFKQGTEQYEYISEIMNASGYKR